MNSAWYRNPPPLLLFSFSLWMLLLLLLFCLFLLFLFNTFDWLVTETSAPPRGLVKQQPFRGTPLHLLSLKTCWAENSQPARPLSKTVWIKFEAIYWSLLIKIKKHLQRCYSKKKINKKETDILFIRWVCIQQIKKCILCIQMSYIG